MAERQVINPASMHRGVFSHALRVGEELYIGAQLPTTAEGRLVAADVETQAGTSFRHMQTILSEAGATWADLVKLNIYLTDLRHTAAVLAVRDRYIAAPCPATTVVAIERLVIPGACLITEGMALIPGTDLRKEASTSMEERRVIDPAGLPEPGLFSQGLRVGDTLYISGQLPIDANRNLVGPDDIIAQTECVFGYLRSILEAAGGGLEHLVKLNIYLTRMQDYEGFKLARSRVLTPPYPISTLVAVKGLVVPGALLEVEGVALLR